MDRTLSQLRRRRTPLRRWLALCVMVFGFQTAAPALTWCLHGGEVAVHGELAVLAPMAHADSTDHCAHHAPDHRMFDARDPGTANTSGSSTAAPPGPALVARLPALDLVAPLHADAAHAGRHAGRAGHPPDTTRIEHLAGATTRLLI